MDELINQLQYCNINTKYAELMRVDIESIKTTYISMMRGHDFDLTLQPNEEIIHCDEDKLRNFIKTKMQNIIYNELILKFSTVNAILLDSIMDYYIELVCSE
tara:strand:- start:1984 stop:2289 length:306 start_codon:yes stop_codon:yes gene_type:complete